MQNFTIGVVLILSLFLCSCGSDQQQGTDKRNSVPRVQSGFPITIAYLPIADCTQLFVALEKGFFKTEGIEANPLVLPSGVKILEALASRDIDVGFSAVVPLMLARSQGLDFVALTGGPAEDSRHSVHALLVQERSPIREARQLEGKTIGIVAFRSIDEVFVKEWLAKKGADVEKVKFLEIPFPQMEPSLLTGAVDAVAAIEPFVTVARNNRKTRVLGQHFVDVVPLTEISSYNARRAWAEEHPEVIQRLRRAFERATAYANEYPEDTRSIIAKHVRLNTEIAREITLPLFTYRLSPESLQSVAGLMVKWRLIDNPSVVRDLVHP